MTVKLNRNISNCSGFSNRYFAVDMYRLHPENNNTSTCSFEMTLTLEKKQITSEKSHSITAYDKPTFCFQFLNYSAAILQS